MQTKLDTKNLIQKNGKKTIRIAFNCDENLGNTFKSLLQLKGTSMTFVFEEMMKTHIGSFTNE